jgi:hypothetical protein
LVPLSAFVGHTCLGVTFKGALRELRFGHPVLPDYLNYIEIRNLRIGDAAIDLLLCRHEQDVAATCSARKAI